jgi:hypothetical protein
MIKLAQESERTFREAIVMRLDEAMARARDSAANLECVAIDLSISVVNHREIQQECSELALCALKEKAS